MVAPVNHTRRGAAVGAGDCSGRQISGRPVPGTWLTPAAVAKATQGEIAARGRTAEGVATDSRTDCTGQLFIALRGQSHDGHAHVATAVQKGARGLLVQRDVALPDLPRTLPQPFIVQVDDTSAALLRLAAEHRRRHRAKVIGITGSCGKTTTKDWLGAVLADAMPTERSPGSFNNQIGVPLTLFRIRPETRAAVVEIGTSSPGEIAQLTAVAQPDIAIVTCVASAHLQGLGSLEGVAREKADLPAGIRGEGLVLLNGDDAACRAMAAVTKGRVKFFAIERPADWFATELRFHALGTSFLLQGRRPVTLPRLGTHNVYNALAVIAAASELGVPEDQILDSLGRVPPAARRLEPKRAAGITVFDDTYNMNPMSARAGLQALAGIPGPGRRIAVFGEMLELGAQSHELHRGLGAEVYRTHMDLLLCVGGGSPIADGAVAAGMPAGAVHRVADPAAALQMLLGTLRVGDLVLVKASRRVGLDRVVDPLVAALAAREAGTQVAGAAGVAAVAPAMEAE